VTDLAAVAERAGLTLVGTRPRFSHYLSDAAHRIPFAATLAWYRVQASLQRNRLGLLWIVLRPMLMSLVYGVVFGFILSSAARPQNFVPFLLIGVFTIDFFTNSLSSGSRAITSNVRLVQSLGFPRVLLPFASTMEQAIRMVPTTVLLYVLLLISGEPPRWSWLLYVPILLLLWLFNLGVAMIAARVSVHARDLQQVIPIINRIVFYASGVFLSIDGLLQGAPWPFRIVQLLPTYDFLEIARDVLMMGHAAPTVAWIAAPIWAVIAFAFGLIYFWQAETRYGIDS